MLSKLRRFIQLFAHGVIYGANVNAVGGGEYIGTALF